MKHEIPDLPFPTHALEPWMSSETLNYHYGKHHKGYIDKLNTLVAGTKFEDAPLEELVLKADGEIYNNAAQAWNHDFFWKCLGPKSADNRSVRHPRIERDFGSMDGFAGELVEMGTKHFASGWLWVTQDGTDARLEISTLPDAGNPLRAGKIPVLTLDLWEHAYYIDHRNDREKYLQALLELLNWEFIGKNLGAASARPGKSI